MGLKLGRRGFLASPLAAVQLAETQQRVHAIGDGVLLSTGEYSQLLVDLARKGKAEPDNFSLGGAVEALEQRVASILGKETAVWLPTGTLANHLAVRILAGSRRRVLVQAESHLYRDCGDCAQTLSGLHMVPLGAGRATFTAEEVQSAADDAVSGRVSAPVGAIQIESPVRRKNGERFDFG